MNIVNLFDYENLAEISLKSGIWDYFHGGSGDEITLCENRAAFERIKLLPRVLRDVRSVDMKTTVQGTAISFPVLIAPTAFHSLVHPEGECATIQGAGKSGTVMVVSTFATRCLEEVASNALVSPWFQVYVYHDIELTGVLVHRAQAAGYCAIVLTVDTPRLGQRERDKRNGFTLPKNLRIANIDPLLIAGEYLPEPAVITWESVAWLRSQTSLPIILKGIVTPEDALIAIEYGVNGIIVSNHGGRQLDGTIAAIDALPPICRAVAGRCEIYVDGGIRRGTDILKALALGARAVLIGRPAIWGLTVDGSNGVENVLEILRNELALAMALAGCSNLEMIDRSLVSPV
jgi:isopentenyl diphosphate isomerase/L-lactate dehydrogenase-like FMN-dependent dehydrogenase